MLLMFLVSLVLLFILLWMIYSLLRSLNIFTVVHEWNHALTYVDGRFDRILPPGRHVRLSLRRQEVFTIRNTDQIQTAPAIDVTSSDKFIFRLTASVTYRVIDPRQAFENEYLSKLPLAISSALIKAAAERTLDAILSDRANLEAAFQALIGSPVCGCEIRSATISAITLPPEIRRLFTEIERAKLEASAALERARGEQAALRSLANAARMLKGNPELMNLRVLQSLSAPGKGRPTLVIGQSGLLPLTSEGEASPST